MARFGGMLQGQRDLAQVSQLVMSELTPLLGAQHGGFFINEPKDDDEHLRLVASYAYKRRKGIPTTFAFGEGSSARRRWAQVDPAHAGAGRLRRDLLRAR
jgi:GAF domain-containing protein